MKVNNTVAFILHAAGKASHAGLSLAEFTESAPKHLKPLIPKARAKSLISEREGRVILTTTGKQAMADAYFGPRR